MALNASTARLAQTLAPTVRTATFQTARSQLCPRCFQQMQRVQRLAPLARRRLATAAAHRPETLQSEPPPPRNSGVPDTSITVEDNAPANVADALSRKSNLSQSSAAKWPSHASIPESEAQSPRSTEHVASGPGSAKGTLASEDVSTPSAKPKRKSKLRPRKAAMSLTPKAVEQLRTLLEQPDPKLIRVGVKNKGCSGLAYHLEYVEKAGAFDEAVEQDGVKVLIDSKALFSIIGSEMDWTEDKLSAKFVFKNPNITEQCGCGESFSIGG